MVTFSRNRNWKRRRRWSLYPVLLLLLSVFVTAQSSTTVLTNPSFNHFNLTSSDTATFHVSPPAAVINRKTAYFITLNFCSYPSGTTTDQLSNLSTTSILFASISSSLSNPSRSSPPSSNLGAFSTANGGFANVTVTPVSTTDGVWIGVTAPDLPLGAVWSFELAVATSGPLHIVGKVPLFQFADSDATNALFVSPTFFPTLNPSPNQQIIAIPSGSEIGLTGLGLSSCFVRNLTGTIPSTQITTSYTSRGVFTLTASQGGTGTDLLEADAGGLRQQYALADLARNTNYTVWGLETMSVMASGQSGTRLYPMQFFATKNGEVFSNFNAIKCAYAKARQQLSSGQRLRYLSRDCLCYPFTP